MSKSALDDKVGYWVAHRHGRMEMKTLKFQVKFKVNEDSLKASGTCYFGLAGIERPHGKSYTILFLMHGRWYGSCIKDIVSIIWFGLS